MIEVPDFGNKDSTAPVRRRTGLDPLSAVKMPEALTAAVDAWAEAHHLSRSATGRIVSGLRRRPHVLFARHGRVRDCD